MSEHTPEPWRVSGCGDEIYADNPIFNTAMVAVSARIPSYAGGVEVAKANLIRAAAAVNACAGIPTESLTRVYPADVVERLVEACEALAAIPVESFRGGNGPGRDPDAVIYGWHLGGGAPVELKVAHVLAARAAIAAVRQHRKDGACK